jgi:hypothetical protein
MAVTNLSLIPINLIDELSALSSTTSFLSSRPLEYLKKPGRSYHAATYNDDDLSIQVNLSYPTTVAGSGLALFGDFSPDAQLRVRAYDGPSSSGDLLFDSGLRPIAAGYDNTFPEYFTFGQPFFFIKLDGGGAASSLDLFLSDTLNPIGFHRMHRLVFGEVFCPATPCRYNASTLGFVDESVLEEDLLGNPHFSTKPKTRTFTFDSSYYTQQEMRKIINCMRYAGKSKDIFAHVRTDNSGADYLVHGMLGRFSENLSISPSRFCNYKISLSIVESMAERQF